MSAPSTPLRLRRPPVDDSAYTSPVAVKHKLEGLGSSSTLGPRSTLHAALVGALAGALLMGGALPLARQALLPARSDTQAAVSTSTPTYLLIDTFESGLNNQRISVLKAAALASRHAYTLVLPAFKDVHGPQHGGGPGDTTILPFSHFYEVPAFEAHARRHNFSVAPALPAHLTQACTKQLSFAASFQYALTRAFYAGWASSHGVVCLTGRAVWFGMEGNDVPDIGWGGNAMHAAGLVPSVLYQREVAGMVGRAAARYGAPASFIAVHIRTEPDWRRVCSIGTDRRRSDHWLATSDRACLVHPRDVVAYLRDAAGVRRGALAFVMSADPLSSMPDLCGEGGYLTCFTPDEVWVDRHPRLEALSHRTQLVRAYVSYLLAERASAVYGNTHSTFSQQLVEGFRAGGKGAAEFYNPKCPLDAPCW